MRLCLGTSVHSLQCAGRREAIFQVPEHCNCGYRDHSLLCSVVQPQCTQPKITLAFSAGLCQCPLLYNAAHCHLSCPVSLDHGLTQSGVLFSELELLLSFVLYSPYLPTHADFETSISYHVSCSSVQRYVK